MMTSREFRRLVVAVSNGYAAADKRVDAGNREEFLRHGKMILSFEECTSLPERELKCPYCSHYIEGVFADTTGHVRVKCNKCKAEMVLNVAYFRRLRKKLQRSRYQYADSYYQHRYK